MRRLPATIPRASDDRNFLAEPLGFLEEARARVGDLFVLRDGAPLFSRSPDCAGVVVALGSDRQQTVLTDIASFGMPPSAAHHLKLPARLANLNRGLHSMRGQEHASRKRILSTILTPPRNGQSYAALRPVLKDAVSGWESARPFGLLSAMRSLAQRSSGHLLFATHRQGDDELTTRLTTYFHLRREASSPANAAQPGDMAKLLAAGNALDRSLRAYVRSCRRLPSKHDEGIFANLAKAEFAAGEPMSEDEVIAHINVLHISSTEPVAVSLAWIMLILTQLPALQELLRRQVREGAPDESMPALDRNRLLDRVINESLRLFPPNAFMVRTTMRPTSLNGADLPEGCEVVLCPLLVHRDPAKFADPSAFLPSRWERANPSPFDYFPFGGGGHACIGRAFALPLIKLVLSFLLEQFEFTLACDQAIDWRLHIMLMPRGDPLVLAQAPKTAGRRTGKLTGPVAGLLNLTEAKLDSTYP